MKNANSRFIRVLAIALVVLMVVPAALVGCGSNKANNAAISEALAAAEEAKKQAEEAKAAAEEAAAKALEEANKKAEAAIKAAEEAQKALEEAMKNTTAAPTTEAPAEDLKVVSEYAYKVLNDKTLDYVKTILVYVYGATEEDLKNDSYVPAGPNPVYASVDLEAMEELAEKAEVAIMKATTVDYINQVVANFVAAIEAIPTYVERVIAAYEAIDFANNYDVIDVVYANAFVDVALDELTGEAETNFITALTKYGEDEIDVLEAIDTEYYRYTGVAGAYADTSAVEEVLYEDMYDDAADIALAVVKLVDPSATEAGIKLDVAALGYTADIDDAVAAAIKMYTKWNNDYFVKAKDTELVKYYEAFRQAFVGEAYVAYEATDYVWNALTAFEARAEELLAAAAEYKETFKSALTKVAGYSEINYWKQAEQVATVKAALDAWKSEYNFKDAEDGTPDANVLAIIGEATYNSYVSNALVVEYFVYLEKTASAVNVDEFLKAYNADLDEDDAIVTFDFAKYGSAVASALDWYFGKEKNSVRENGFIHIVPSAVKGFNALADATYGVNALIAADNANIVKIFDNLFDLDILDEDATAFADMLTAYDALLAKKKAADLINKNIAEALEEGAGIEVFDAVVEFIGADPEAVLNPEDDDDLYLAVAGTVGTWAAGYIAKGDANFESMIDWANIEALYANYKASTVEIEKVAIKIALEYIAWAGTYDAEDEEIEFAGKVFEDLEPLQIDIFSYDIVKEIVETYEALQGIEKSDISVNVPVNEDEVLVITLKTVTDYCYDMLTYFYDMVDTLNAELYATIYQGYPLHYFSAYKNNAPAFSRTDVVNPWFTSTESQNESGMTVVVNRIATKYSITDTTIKNGIRAALKNDTIFYGKGTAIGNYSLTGAIDGINPNSYAIKNSNGVVTGFDSAAYKNAVMNNVKTVYASYINSYIKSAAYAADLDQAITILAEETLKMGIWSFEDEIVINGDVYDFAVNTTGSAWEFVVTDASGDVVGKAAAGQYVDVAVKYDGDEYTVRLTPELKTADDAEGKFVVTPVLVETAEITVFDLLDDISAKDFADAKALTYDVRDYVEEIVANLDKVTNIPLLGNKSKNLDTFTADQINTIIDAEAKNDFWVEFATVKARMYNSNTTIHNWLFGDYVVGFAGLDEAVKTKLNAISKIAYEKANGMTADANTIEDVVKVFNTFKSDINNVLAENEIEFATATVNGYEQITIQ